MTWTPAHGPTDRISDADLLRAVGAGDAGAIRVFVERHQASLLRYLRGVLGDAAGAEDALQETFLAAFRSAAGYRGEATAATWLFTIARNHALRRRRRESATVALPDSEAIEALGRAAGWGAGEDDDPEAALAREEARAAVTRALDGLDPADREVLVLRDLEGLPGDEVAGILGVGLAAMKSRLHRARLRLTAALGRANEEPWR